MPSTSRGYPYPSGLDDVDIPGDMAALAAAINTDVGTVVTNAVQHSLADAAGDLAVGSAADTFGKLALGTDNYALTVNTAGSGVAKVGWEDPTANPLTTAAMALKVNTATVGNLLIANQASGTDTSSDTTGYTSYVAATLTSNAVEYLQGTRSLAAEATAASSNVRAAVDGSRSSFVQVVAGQTYTFSLWVKSSAARTTIVSILWHTELAYLSASSASITSTTSGWSRVLVTAVAPATATRAEPVFGTNGNTVGDIHYYDCLGFWEGAGGQWALPGTPITNLGFYTDESVGRRLFQWDANNSRFQQTFGDTGWRSVTDLLVNGWLTSADRITIRRQNNVVTLMLGDMDGRSATTDVIMTLPSGFRPNWQYNVPSYATSGATSSRSVNAVHTGNVTWCGTPRPTYENALFTYLTSDAWPTTLPGTAVGSIPA